MMLAISCTCQTSQKKTGDDAKDDETIDNLVLIESSSPNMPSYPLMCVNGGDYPNGVELVFRKQDDGKTWVHAAFPEGMKTPDKTDGTFVLKGRFQKIKNRDRFVHKKPPRDYQYFVVKSWTKQE